MPYNFVADCFHTKELCRPSRLYSSEVHEIRRKSAVLRFWVPFGGNVRWSSQAHWKARSGLPISIYWTFSL